MPSGGARTGAGRPKGSPNKASIARQERIAAEGITPLDWMLQVMRDPAVDYARRDEMAKAAAPYVHPKLAAVEHSGTGEGGSIEVDVVQRVIVEATDSDSQGIPSAT